MNTLRSGCGRRYLLDVTIEELTILLVALRMMRVRRMGLVRGIDSVDQRVNSATKMEEALGKLLLQK